MPSLLDVGLWIAIAYLLYLVLGSIWEWRKIRQTDRFIKETEALLMSIQKRSWPDGAVAWKYADPTEAARWIYDNAEAERIAHEDPTLIVWKRERRAE